MSLMEYSGRGGHRDAGQALSDARGRPFAEIMQEQVLDPIGMEHSTFQQPSPRNGTGNAARAHSPGRGRPWGRSGTSIRSFGRRRALDHPQRPGPLCHRGAALRPGGNRTGSSPGPPCREMLTPVGVGGLRVGFSIAKRGQGWYFSHGGSNCRIPGHAHGHRAKGYGLAIMTNGAQGRPAHRGSEPADPDGRTGGIPWREPAPRGYRPPAPRTEIQPPRRDPAGLRGRVRTGPRRHDRHHAGGGAALRAAPPGRSGSPPLPGGAGPRFSCGWWMPRWSSPGGSDGEVTELVLTQGGTQQNRQADSARRGVTYLPSTTSSPPAP